MTPEQQPEQQQPEQSKESIFAALWNEIKNAPNFTVTLQKMTHEGIELAMEKRKENKTSAMIAARCAEFYEFCIFEILASGETTPRNSAMLEILKARRDFSRTFQLERIENSANNERTKANREFWADLVRKTKSAVFDFILYDIMQRPLRYEDGVIASGDLPFGHFDGQILTLRNTEHKTVIKSLFLLARNGHPFFKKFFISGAEKNNQWKDSAIFTALKQSGKLKFADREISALHSEMSGKFNANALKRTKEIPLLTEILSQVLTE